jgi:hypothetical protein
MWHLRFVALRYVATSTKRLKKTENIFQICILESHFTFISGLGGSNLPKKVKVVVPFCPVYGIRGYRFNDLWKIGEVLYVASERTQLLFRFCAWVSYLCTGLILWIHQPKQIIIRKERRNTKILQVQYTNQVTEIFNLNQKWPLLWATLRTNKLRI